MTPAEATYLGGAFIGAITCVVAYIYLRWVHVELDNARAEAEQLRRELAKVVEEREAPRTAYLQARYGRGRVV